MRQTASGRKLPMSRALLQATASPPRWRSCPIGTGAMAAVDADTYRELDQFMDVFDRVKANYVDKVDDKTLIKGAIDGMLASLDPHSSYLDALDFENTADPDRRQLWRPRPHRHDGGRRGQGHHADRGHARLARAGIKAGDYITHLDGTADLWRHARRGDRARCAASPAPRSRSPSSAPAATSRSTSR